MSSTSLTRDVCAVLEAVAWTDLWLADFWKCHVQVKCHYTALTSARSLPRFARRGRIRAWLYREGLSHACMCWKCIWSFTSENPNCLRPRRKQMLGQQTISCCLYIACPMPDSNLSLHDRIWNGGTAHPCWKQLVGASDGNCKLQVWRKHIVGPKDNS